jgi:hypothetical protein
LDITLSLSGALFLSHVLSFSLSFSLSLSLSIFLVLSLSLSLYNIWLSLSLSMGHKIENDQRALKAVNKIKHKSITRAVDIQV